MGPPRGHLLFAPWNCPDDSHRRPATDPKKKHPIFLFAQCEQRCGREESWVFFLWVTRILAISLV